jgi:hypothetical protein
VLRAPARRLAPIAAALAATALAAAPGAAAAPYSFLATPTDQLAVPGALAGAEITPEGHVYTGWGELVLRVGPRLAEYDQPIRTLERGRYPIVRSSVDAGGVRYSVEQFASPVRGHPVVFVRVTMRGLRSRPARARLAAAMRHAGDRPLPSGQHRFRFARPAGAARAGLYRQPGEAFDPRAEHALAGDALLRGGRVLYLFSRAPASVARAVRLRPGRAGARVTPRTLFGEARYATTLGRGDAVRVDFRVPLGPVGPGDELHRAIAGASAVEHRASVLATWRALFGRAAGVAIPERKVEDAWYASLANLVLPRYRDEEGRWVQTVNKLQYHAFWLRDAAVMTQALDLAGLHDLAGENLPFFLAWQQPDGLFISRPGQLDGFGQALWAIGEHVARSGDVALGRALLPSVERAMTWFENARRADPLRLLPAGDPGDNELAAGHLSGDNFWAVAGVRSAVGLARALGEAALAERWSAELADYEPTVRAQVRGTLGRTRGVIPPAIDAAGGQDWGNLWAAWPAGPFDPSDPAVTRTLRHLRGEFREGIATYLDGRVLHHYLGFRAFQTELLRGEQSRVVRGLYDSLAHTTATHGGFETGIRPYGSRSVHDNMTPHGWFAAEYVALVRNMLAREDHEGLVLMSALSPAWLRPGKTVALRYAPTTRGRITFELRTRRGGATLRWRAEVPQGTRLRWPVPAGVRSMRAAGLPRGGRIVELPGRAGTMRVRWRLRPGAPPTYEAAVRRLVRAYRARGR